MSRPLRRKRTSRELARLVRDIVRMQGGDAEEFTVARQPDGRVKVTGPGATAYYNPGEPWTKTFARHLLEGLFTVKDSRGAHEVARDGADTRCS